MFTVVLSPPKMPAIVLMEGTSHVRMTEVAMFWFCSAEARHTGQWVRNGATVMETSFTVVGSTTEWRTALYGPESVIPWLPMKLQ